MQPIIAIADIEAHEPIKLEFGLELASEYLVDGLVLNLFAHTAEMKTFHSTLDQHSRHFHFFKSIVLK